MLQVPLKMMKDDLSKYVEMSTGQDIIITKHGVPAAILIGVSDPAEVWEQMLIQDTRFKKRIARARQSAKEGRTFSLDQIREEFGLEKKIVKSKKKDAPPKVSKPSRRTATTP